MSMMLLLTLGLLTADPQGRPGPATGQTSRPATPTPTTSVLTPDAADAARQSHEKPNSAKLAAIKKTLISKYGPRFEGVQLDEAEKGDTEVGGEVYRDSGTLTIAVNPCDPVSVDRATTFYKEYDEKDLDSPFTCNGTTYKKLRVTQGERR